MRTSEICLYCLLSKLDIHYTDSKSTYMAPNSIYSHINIYIYILARSETIRREIREPDGNRYRGKQNRKTRGRINEYSVGT